MAPSASRSARDSQSFFSLSRFIILQPRFLLIIPSLTGLGKSHRVPRSTWFVPIGISIPHRNMRKSPTPVLGPSHVSIRNTFMPEKTTLSLLTLEIDRIGTKAVVRCRGMLVSGVDEVLYITVKQLIPDYKRIVLDLTDLVRMDSMGLGALVRLYVSARSAGCDLQLKNLGKQVRHLLGMTNLLDVFAIIGEHGVKIG
jgi:anti-sigma B factor antagonist